MITVFYDGKCGLCAREINHYRKIAPTGIFVWEDITESTAGLDKLGISLVDGLMALHTLEPDGKLHKGADAFIVIWQQLDTWRWLAKFAALPIIRPLANLIYKVFAFWRFRFSRHCQLAAKQIKAG